MLLDAFNVDQAGASMSFCSHVKRKQGLGNHKVHHFLAGSQLCSIRPSGAVGNLCLKHTLSIDFVFNNGNEVYDAS